MQLAAGTEPRNEYLSLEVAAGARKLVQDVMLVSPGENVVITADTSSDARVVSATAAAVYAAAGIPTVIWYDTRPTAVVEPPGPVRGAVARADVWIEFAFAYILYTQAFKEALAAGARYICLAGMDVDMLTKTVGRVDYPRLLALGETLRRLVEAADEVHVTSPAGTDLLAYNRGRLARQSGKLADTPGEAIMLGGQVSWCPIEETINGTLVFDGGLRALMMNGCSGSPTTRLVSTPE
jgi:leucyl aminopeptidase (aminopeptidase T)